MDEIKNETNEIINSEETPEFEKEIKYADAFVLKDSGDDKASEKKGWLKELYEWSQAICFAVIFALIINQFLFSIVQVEGLSMYPTLDNKEKLIVGKLLYTPENGDIVIIKSSALNKYIVKRVIALPGQVLDINPQTGEVSVDGKVLDEPYIFENLHSSGARYEYPLTVPEKSVFVMGDNRNNSQDSRSIGVIPYSELVGKAVFRILPFSEFGGLY